MTYDPLLTLHIGSNLSVFDGKKMAIDDTPYQHNQRWWWQKPHLKGMHS
ncbi:hypothetical protein [Rhabdochlamydiaceae symbiont of Dictyostelium giganteum]